MAHTPITQRIHHSQTLALKGIIAEQEREISRLRRMIIGKTSESQVPDNNPDKVSGERDTSRDTLSGERDYGTGGDEFINPATGIDDWRD
jgi:hypothetical protein